MPLIHVSERKRAANRANAQKSTGPRTPQGKAISRMNAVEHGFRSRDVIVPMLGETADNFSTFYTAVVDDLNPQNAVQLLLAEEVATNFWRLRRARRLQTGCELSITHDLYYNGISFDPKTRQKYSYWDDPEKNYPDNVLRQATEQFAKTAYIREFFFRVANHEQRLSNSIQRSLTRYFKTPIDVEPEDPQATEAETTPETTTSPTTEPKTPIKSTPPIAAILALIMLLLGALATRVTATKPAATYIAAPQKIVNTSNGATIKPKTPIKSTRKTPAAPPARRLTRYALTQLTS